MKKIIDISNYEEILIDFLDGNLDEESRALVLLFLDSHPDIAQEFDGIADVNVEECIGSLSDKSELKVHFDTVILLNHDNYEFYFIAYHEGDLSDDEKIQVEDFIDQNPSLMPEFEQFLQVSAIDRHEEIFDDKSDIKFVELSTNDFVSYSDFEILCVDSVEGNISDEDSIKLSKAISENSELESLFALYAKTKLHADESIVFDNKESLYQRTFIQAVNYNIRYVNSIAAAVAILFIFNVFNFNLDKINTGIKASATNSINVVVDSPNSIKPVDKQNVDTKGNADTAELIDVDTEKQQVNPKPLKVIKAKRNIVKRHELELVTVDIKGIKEMLPSSKAPVFAESTALHLEAFVIDTASVLVVATEPDSDKATQRTKSLKRIGGKINRIIEHEKEYIANAETKETVRRFADMAIKGFNKMTEGDFFISRRDSAPMDN